MTFTSCFVVYPVCLCAILVSKETASVQRPFSLKCLIQLRLLFNICLGALRKKKQYILVYAKIINI